MNIKRSQKIVFAGIPVFIFIILFLGWLSYKKVSEVVTDNFNQQQLILARNAANLIKNDVDSLKNQLSELSLVISNKQSLSYLHSIMKIHYIGIRDKGGIEVKYIDRESMFAYSFDDKGFKKTKASFADFDFYKKLAESKKVVKKYILPKFLQKIIKV